VLSDAIPDDVFQPGARVAQNDPLSGYPVDLRAEERLGGHTIEQHVQVSQEGLRRRVSQEADDIIERGDEFEGLSIGSFNSFESATRHRECNNRKKSRSRS
jgi:hypothetical protein